MNTNTDNILVGEVVEDVKPVLTESQSIETSEQREMKRRFELYMKSRENHQPGKVHDFGDTVYNVSPSGAWLRSKPEDVVNPNMKNHSVRVKLERHPKKYTVVNI